MRVPFLGGDATVASVLVGRAQLPQELGDIGSRRLGAVAAGDRLPGLRQVQRGLVAAVRGVHVGAAFDQLADDTAEATTHRVVEWRAAVAAGQVHVHPQIQHRGGQVDDHRLFVGQVAGYA